MRRFLHGLIVAGASSALVSACRPAPDAPAPAPAAAPATPVVSPAPGGLPRLPADAATVAAEIEALDLMRSSLAGPLGARAEPVDDSTFARVCKPVGMKARGLAETYGWSVRQVATRFRNPANAADSTLAGQIGMFESDPGLVSAWHRSGDASAPGWRYSRRITVETACLTCHGARDERPDFVQSAYPEDRAFGFEPGDLRGLYVVFVPDKP